MATPEPPTYRHEPLDVEVSLARVESMIRGKEDGTYVRVGSSPLGGGVIHADVWNVRVLVEELRAQFAANPGPLPRPNDPVVASALEGLEAWLDETGADRTDTLMISSGHQGAAVFMVSSTFSIAAGVLAEVLRKATVGNRPAPSKGSAEVHVKVTPEVDREVLGDLASDLAEAVAARLLDRLPVIVDPATGPRGISFTPPQEEAFDREEALRLAVEHHGKDGISSKMVTSTARDFARFLATGEPVRYAPKLNFLRAWIREHFDGVEDEFEIVLAGTDDAPELRLALGQLRELVTYLEGIDS